MHDFAGFIDRLSLVQTASDAYNQYGAGDNLYNAIRRANLSRYLQDLYTRQSKWMLLGEAPGRDALDRTANDWTPPTS